MIQFREIKRIFKEVTGKRCRVFWKNGKVCAEYVCYYSYGKQEPIYKFCLQAYPEFLEDEKESESILKRYFLQFK